MPPLPPLSPFAAFGIIGALGLLILLLFTCLVKAVREMGWEYIGQLKHIYEFATIEEAIEGTRPVTQEQHLEGRLTNEVHRRELLAMHYHNALLYGVKLRDALEKIKQAAELDENPDEKIAQIAKEALLDPHPEAIMARRQSERLREQYGDNVFHGHPYDEYLHLPMKPSDEYVDPFKPR